MRLNSPKYIIPIALLAGFLASFIVYRFIIEREKNIRMSYESEDVIVASRNLSIGKVLAEADLQIKKYPKDLVIEGSFSSYDELVGRVLRTEILPGESILESKLAPVGSGGGVIGLIPPGMRAMTVAVNVVSGVGGFILPQSRVDIIATVNPAGSRDQSVTRTILQDVMVLAVDQTYNKNDHNPITVKSVTLLVNPEEAENLALASTEGRLQLSLRGTVDTNLVKTEGVRFQNLITGPRPSIQTVRRVVSPAPPPPTGTNRAKTHNSRGSPFDGPFGNHI